jgi:hypothetical protein
MAGRRCRQNRGSRRRSFASRIGRRAAARRWPSAQLGTDAPARHPAGWALPPGVHRTSSLSPTPRPDRVAPRTRPGQGRTRVTASGPPGALVERGMPSDMLPRLNCLGISRGFEFSRPCVRCPRPAPEASAIGRSCGAGRVMTRSPSRCSCGCLDTVRILCRSAVPGACLRVAASTPGGGIRGVVPPRSEAQGRADRPITTRRLHGFRTGRLVPNAARGLQHASGGWPIRRFRRWCLDHAWGR